MAFLDPARPGCWHRFKRAALGCLGLTACSLGVAATIAVTRPMGRYGLGAALVSMGQAGRGLRVAESLVADHPDQNAGFYLLKAAAERSVGDREASARTLDDAVHRFPRSYAANDDRCFYGTLFGDKKAAMPYCDQAVALTRPSEATRAHAHRGLARALAGDRDGAVADLEHAATTWQALGVEDRPVVAPYRDLLEALNAGADVTEAASTAHERLMR